MTKSAVRRRQPVTNCPISNAMCEFMDQQVGRALTLMTIKGHGTVWTVNDIKILIKSEVETFSCLGSVGLSPPPDGRLSVKVPHNKNVIIWVPIHQVSQPG